MTKNENTPAQDTVVLLRLSLLIIVSLVAIGALVAALFSVSYGAIISGVGRFAIGGIIISFRRIIWDAYLDSYSSKHASNLIDKIIKPSRLSYKLNIIFIWPVVMLIGLILVFYGVFNNL